MFADERLLEVLSFIEGVSLLIEVVVFSSDVICSRELDSLVDTELGAIDEVDE